MPIVIDETIEIDASPETVWRVITDFNRYCEWNPFVIGCESTLRVGDPIDMRVHVFRSFAQPQRETITHHEPGRRFCYGVPDMPFGAMRSQRCHQVSRLEGGRTVYQSHFDLSGWLSPIVSFLLGRQLRRGFSEMTRAIRGRSQELAGEPR